MKLVTTANTWKIEHEDGDTFMQGVFEPEVDLNIKAWYFFDQITALVSEASGLQLAYHDEVAYVSDDAKTVAWEVSIIAGWCRVAIHADGDAWKITDDYGNTLLAGDLDPEIDMTAEKLDLDAVTERIAQLSGIKLAATSHAAPSEGWLTWEAVEEI